MLQDLLRIRTHFCNAFSHFAQQNMAQPAASVEFNRHRYVRHPSGRWQPMADAGILTKYHGAYTHIPDAEERMKFEKKHRIIQCKVYHPWKGKRGSPPPPPSALGSQDVRKRSNSGIDCTVYHPCSTQAKSKRKRRSPPPPPSQHTQNVPLYPFGRQDVRRYFQ